MNHKLNDRLSVNARVSYDQMKVYGMGTSEGGDRFNKMQHILQYRPMIGIDVYKRQAFSETRRAECGWVHTGED